MEFFYFYRIEEVGIYLWVLVGLMFIDKVLEWKYFVCFFNKILVRDLKEKYYSQWVVNMSGNVRVMNQLIYFYLVFFCERGGEDMVFVFKFFIILEWS